MVIALTGSTPRSGQNESCKRRAFETLETKWIQHHAFGFRGLERGPKINEYEKPIHIAGRYGGELL